MEPPAMIPANPNPARQTVLGLIERAISALGGRELPEPCRAEELPVKVGGEVSYSCGCGGQTRFAIPYQGRSNRARFVTLCAVCDRADAMPRVRKAARQHGR